MKFLFPAHIIKASPHYCKGLIHSGHEQDACASEGQFLNKSANRLFLLFIKLSLLFLWATFRLSILTPFETGTKQKRSTEYCKPFAIRTGLEPATSAVTGRHSNQLNYRINFLRKLIKTSAIRTGLVLFQEKPYP